MAMIETPRTNLGRLLADVVAMLDRAIDARAREIGITGPQWVVLIRIGGGMGDTAAKLCRSIGYDSGSMTRMLDRLEKLALIRRDRSRSDRRIVQLALTEQGKRFYQELQPIARDVLGDHLGDFSDEEVVLLTGLLTRMLKNGGES